MPKLAYSSRLSQCNSLTIIFLIPINTDSGLKPTNGKRSQKTGETDRSHASIFLRIGGIVFGLGVMVYNGLEFGAYFEIPYKSPCYSVLLGN